MRDDDSKVSETYCIVEHCAISMRENWCILKKHGFDYRFNPESNGFSIGSTLEFPCGKRVVGCSKFIVRALCIFLHNLNVPLLKSDICHHVWLGRAVGENSLPVLINELRTILNDTEYKVITIRGFGYLLAKC